MEEEENGSDKKLYMIRFDSVRKLAITRRPNLYYLGYNFCLLYSLVLFFHFSYLLQLTVDKIIYGILLLHLSFTCVEYKK